MTYKFYPQIGKREFGKLLTRISPFKRIGGKKVRRLDVSKIGDLTEDERGGMVQHIVKYRQPIVKDLIPDGFDMQWLFCMGYGHETQGKDYTFIHTCEHRIR